MFRTPFYRFQSGTSCRLLKFAYVAEFLSLVDHWYCRKIDGITGFVDANEDRRARHIHCANRQR